MAMQQNQSYYQWPYQQTQMMTVQEHKKSKEKTLRQEQRQCARAYQKASAEERRTQKFFRDLPLENMIDYESIAYARRAGLTDPVFLTGRMSTQLVQKINYIKCKNRSNHLLRKWISDGYWCRQNDVLKVRDPQTFTDTIERVNVNDITVEQFIERYEKGSRPCILTGVTENWQGNTDWQLKRLLERFPEAKFKVGVSDQGHKLRVTMKEYIEYAIYNRDDSPLYLFESSIERHPQIKEIIDEYEPPHVLQKDFFVELLGENKAPPHRWFLIGPRRSGSEVHQDPLGTSAWNTSVCGHKRWVMIPPGPGITKKFVRGHHLMKPGEQKEAINYFDKVLPRLKAVEGPQGSNRLPVIIEGVQYPGETIFVPGNWWHGVQNLDLTIAITQNFVNKGNFDKVWLCTRGDLKKLSVKFLDALKQTYPQYYTMAVKMNQRDNFVMWDKRDRYKHKFNKKPTAPKPSQLKGSQQQVPGEETKEGQHQNRSESQSSISSNSEDQHSDSSNSSSDSETRFSNNVHADSSSDSEDSSDSESNDIDISSNDESQSNSSNIRRKLQMVEQIPIKNQQEETGKKMESDLVHPSSTLNIDILIQAQLQLSSIERLKKCAAIKCIFGYFDLVELTTIQNMNQKFYSVHLPDIVHRVPINKELIRLDPIFKLMSLNSKQMVWGGQNNLLVFDSIGAQNQQDQKNLQWRQLAYFTRNSQTDVIPDNWPREWPKSAQIAPEKFLLVGGMSDLGGLFETCVLVDCKLGVAQQVANLPNQGRGYHQVLFVPPTKEAENNQGSQGFVYCVTGDSQLDQEKANRQCFRYSIQNNQWSELASFPKIRIDHYANFSAHLLGSDSRFILAYRQDFAALYDIKFNRWTNVLVKYETDDNQVSFLGDGQCQVGMLALPYWCYQETVLRKQRKGKRSKNCQNHFELLLFGGSSLFMVQGLIPNVSTYVHRALLDISYDGSNDASKQVISATMRLRHQMTSTGEKCSLAKGDRFFYQHTRFLQSPTSQLMDIQKDKTPTSWFNRFRYVGVAGRNAFHVLDLHQMSFIYSDKSQGYAFHMRDYD